MGLEYIAQPQVFLSPISAQQGIRGLIENYPLLTTFQSWTSTTGTQTSSLQIGGFWTMLEKPSLTGEAVPESFIVTVGGVVQAPDSYRIFNYPIRKIDFVSTIPQGIEVNLTQLATHSPSSQRFNYLRADSALITNLTSTTIVFLTSFTVTENLSAFTVTDIIAQNTLSAGVINTGSINSSTILSAGTNLYNLFVPVVGGTITSNSSNPALRITQSGSGNALLVEDVASDTSPFVIDSNGRVGIGTTALSQALTLESTSTDGVQVIRTSGDTTPSTLLLSKARGTPSAKTTVTQNDVLGQVVFQGWDNVGSFNPAAAIESIVSETVGLSTIPAHLIFKTNQSSTAPTERLRITSSGNVGINTTTPNEILTVVGNISATGNIQSGGFPVPRKFATSITGSAISHTITHNLGTRDVVVSIYDSASPFDVIITSVAHTTTNTVTVDLDPAPGAKIYRVVVIG
jgi:hypothetical protein